MFWNESIRRRLSRNRSLRLYDPEEDPAAAAFYSRTYGTGSKVYHLCESTPATLILHISASTYKEYNDDLHREGIYAPVTGCLFSTEDNQDEEVQNSHLPLEKRMPRVAVHYLLNDGLQRHLKSGIEYTTQTRSAMQSHEMI